MTKKEKWIVDKDDGLRLFYGDANFNGSAYPCDDIVFMKKIADKLNKLQDKCDKKQEHIVVLENKIRRMREAIHKLEWLASHRNADLQRENWQLKQQLNDKEVEWLRNNTVWEQMPSSKRTFYKNE